MYDEEDFANCRVEMGKSDGTRGGTCGPAENGVSLKINGCVVRHFEYMDVLSNIGI